MNIPHAIHAFRRPSVPRNRFRPECRPVTLALRDWLQPDKTDPKAAREPSKPAPKKIPDMTDLEWIAMNKMPYYFPEALDYLLRELRIKAGHPLQGDLDDDGRPVPPVLPGRHNSEEQRSDFPQLENPGSEPNDRFQPTG